MSDKPRIRPPSQSEVDRLPEYIKRTMSTHGMHQLAATIRQYEKVGTPDVGEVCYTGDGRYTGYTSSLNSFNGYGYYTSSDIPINVLDAMRRDYMVALGMAIVKYPITTLGYTVNCKNPIIKEFIKTVFKKSWSGILRDCCLSFDYGFTGFEKVWENVRMDIDPGENKHKIRNKMFTVLKKLKPLSPTTIGLRLDELNNFLGLKQKSKLGRNDVIMNRQKSMLITYQMEFGNYFGRPRLSTAYEAWYYKILSTQFFLRWLERRSIPAYIVRYPKGKTPTASGDMANANIAFMMAQAISSYGNLTMPSQRDDKGHLHWDIDVLKQGEQNLTLDKVVEDVWNLAIIRGLLIPDKKALGGLSPDIASEIFLSTLGDFVKYVEEQINTELVAPLVAWNFPDTEDSKCTLNIDDIDFHKREEMRKLLSKMMDMSATYIKQLGGLPFDVMPDMKRMLEKVDIPPAKVALYKMPIFDPSGKDITPDYAKQIKNEEKAKANAAKSPAPDNGNNANKGPSKGEKTSGNQSRTDRNGNPRDEDKNDQSNA